LSVEEAVVAEAGAGEEVVVVAAVAVATDARCCTDQWH
jgi:hypothetical protein